MICLISKKLGHSPEATLSRFPDISAQPVFFGTFLHNLELPAQFCTVSIIKTNNLYKNWVEFRHLGRVKTKAGFSLNNWGEFRQKLGLV